MQVRIRLHYGPRVRRKEPKNRHLASAVASLLAPAGLTASALAFWRLGSDLGLARQFIITAGLFSHWQVWLAVAGLVQFTATMLNRYGAGRAFVQDSGEKPRSAVLNSEV